MNPHNFQLIWYVTDLDKRKKFKQKFIYVTLLFLVICCTIKYFYNKNYIWTLETTIENNNNFKEESYKKDSLKKVEKYLPIDTFINFKNFIEKRYSIENIYVSKNSIILESKFPNMTALTRFIKDIEENKFYRIEKFDLESIDDSIIVKINLEVNKYEK